SHRLRTGRSCGDGIAKRQWRSDHIEGLSTLADPQDRYVAVVEDATEDALVDVNALNLVDTHLECLPFNKAGLVDDAEIGDVGFSGPAMEPGGCRLVQRS